MIHSWDNSPPISLSFKLAFVVPRRCIYALTSIIFINKIFKNLKIFININ